VSAVHLQRLLGSCSLVSPKRIVLFGLRFLGEENESFGFGQEIVPQL
jgi:hypothetical protein